MIYSLRKRACNLASKAIWKLPLLSILLAMPAAAQAQQPSVEAPATAAPDTITLKQLSKAFSAVGKKAIPAVVFVEAQSQPHQTRFHNPRRGAGGGGRHQPPFDLFDDQYFQFSPVQPMPKEFQSQGPAVAQGSGFIVNADGYILTNNHIVEGAKEITITLTDGKKLTAEVVGTDPKTDLAVLKIEGNDHPFISLGDSDAIDIGEWAIAIGNPFGLQGSLTVGVISAKGRHDLNITHFENFLQTDAAINPGNSGGPLLDIDGNVIGINTVILTGTGGYMGIGFAIPSNTAKNVMNQLIDKGSVTRGFIGITLQPMTRELSKAFGLSTDATQGGVVAQIVPGSPADKAGVKQGDIVTGFDDQVIDSPSILKNVVAGMKPGETLTLNVNRDGKLMQLKVVVGSREEVEEVDSNVLKTLDFEIEDITADKRESLGLSNENGVLISEVESNSPAAAAGLMSGQIIQSVNRKPVNSKTEFLAALAGTKEETTDGKDAQEKKSPSILLLIKDNQNSRYVTLKIGT